MTAITRNTVFLLFLSLLATTSAVGQWRIATPRQMLPVPSDGSTVNYPNVSLPVGMTYHIHADGRAQVSSSGDIADACYYVNIISFSPYVVPVAMKVRSSPSQESWVYDLLSPQNYHSNHIYDVSLASAGNPLSLRFFDRNDPPSAYYNDNTGSINVEVAQQTPEIVAKYDTVYFNNVLVGKSMTQLDSLASYGTDGYRCDNVAMTGPSAARFQVFGQVVPFGIQESVVEFQFVYSPTTVGTDTAYFHLYSSNVYAPQKDFVIMLIGNGVGSSLSARPDTLKFGTIRVNTSKILTEMFKNAGSSGVNVTSIVMAPATAPFSNAPTPILVGGRDSAGCNVTFNPTTQGAFFATFTCSADDGSTLKFYATGASGLPVAYLSDSVLVFGRMLMNRSVTLTDTILNVGNVDLNIVSTLNTNPSEYSVVGAQGPHFYPPLSGAVYAFTFTPRVHIPFWGNHDGAFTYYFSDGTSRTIVFKGCDHDAISTRLAIDTNYYVTPGNTIEVSQKLLDQLDSSYTPIRALHEKISFDQQTFDFISARRGTMTNTPDWNLSASASGGTISVDLTTTNGHLGQPGSTVLLTFRAHSDATPDQLTLLPQLGVDFENNFEPLWTSSSGRITVTDLCTPVHLGQLVTPKASFVEQNTPNPVTHQTTINYTIGKFGSDDAINTRIRLYDEMGRLVKTLLDEPRQAGRYELTVASDELPAGIYWYRFEAGGVTQMRSMIVAR